MLACFPARSDLLPPLASIADTTISDGDGAHVNGAAPDMIVGGLLQFPAPCRGLLRFDLSSLPPTATITSVTLTVTVTMSKAEGVEHVHKLRRMLAPWHETEALWNNSGFAPWFGGDFAEEDDGTTSLGDPGTYTFASTTGLIATVQFWQTNPAANHGWVLMSDSEFEDGTARRIATHESMGGQPTLIIGYSTTPPPPADFYVTSPGFGYAINEQDGNPTLTLTRGSNYVFDITTDPSHPFQIASGPNFGDPAYNDGVSNNNISSGRISFTVPLNAPDTLYYVCSIHFFGGVINIVDPSSPPAPLVQIVSMDLSSSNVVLRSLGTNGWLAIPEFSSNIVSSNWAVVPNFTNTFANGTNVTVFNRLDPICGPNVFLRMKNTRAP
jgi:hypothetical protein